MKEKRRRADRSLEWLPSPLSHRYHRLSFLFKPLERNANTRTHKHSNQKNVRLFHTCVGTAKCWGPEEPRRGRKGRGSKRQSLVSRAWQTQHWSPKGSSTTDCENVKWPSRHGPFSWWSSDRSGLPSMPLYPDAEQEKPDLTLWKFKPEK